MSSKKLIQIITEGSSSYETPDTFNEHLKNPENIPITISLDDRKDGDPGTMHYSDTCEILLFEKITGSVFIAGRTHKIDPHSVFIFQPEWFTQQEYQKDLTAFMFLSFPRPNWKSMLI